MRNRDDISLRYFNQQGITLVLDESVKDEDFDVFNNLEELSRLTGAPDGSHISVSRGCGEFDTVNLQVKNAIFKYPSVYVIVNQGGQISFQLEIDSIYVRDEFQDQGIGVRSVMLSIYQAKAWGFASVNLWAAGSAKDRSTFFGYHVWPSIGFDAELPTEIRRELPPEHSSASRLSDLITTESGSEWWYDRGRPIELSFDLSDNSVSWKLLNEYAEVKGIWL